MTIDQAGFSGKNATRQRGAWYIWMLAFVAALGGFLFGYDLALISGAIIFVQEHFGLSESLKGWVISSAMIGSLAGPILGLWVADRLGRNRGLIVSAFLLMISAIGSALAGDVAMLITWRVIGGVGVGLASVISPIYIAEIAPARIRGKLVTTNQLAIVVGLLISILVDYAFSFGGHWRWMFGVEAIPILLFFVFLLIIPKSPRWMVMKGKNTEAFRTLSMISGHELAEREMKEIRADLNKDTGSFKELFRPGLRTALFVGIMIMLYNQIVGTTILHMYAPSIMLDVGIGNASDSILSAAYIDTFMIICTILAFYVIGKLGRRQVLYLGFALIATGHLLMAASIHFDSKPVWSLVALCVSIGAHSLTIGPIPWVICTEIFPNKLRAKAMSVTMIGFYLANSMGNTFFPQVSAYFKELHGGNDTALYLILFIVCITGVLFTRFFVPETRGLTLEQIHEFWLNRRKKV